MYIYVNFSLGLLDLYLEIIFLIQKHYLGWFIIYSWSHENCSFSVQYFKEHYPWAQVAKGTIFMA